MLVRDEKNIRLPLKSIDLGRLTKITNYVFIQKYHSIHTRLTFLSNNNVSPKKGISKKYMDLIDSEKVYNRLPRKVFWWAMTKKDILKKNSNIVQNMYQEEMTNVRTCGETTNDFPITIGLHQGLTISPLLFAPVR